MCGVTGAIASIAMTALSAASRIKAQDASAEAYNQQLQHQIQQEEYNKAAAREQVKVSLAEGEVEADNQRRSASRKQGEQTSMLAASGFELDSGSVESLLAEGAEEAAHENARIRQEAAMNAWKQQSYIDMATNSQGLLRLKKDAIQVQDDKTQSLLGGLNSISRKVRGIS